MNPEDAAPDTAPWVTVAAAARRLGVSERAVRRRIERGSLEARREERGNKVRLLVRLDAPHGGADQDAAPGAAAVESELRARIAHLEGEVAWLRTELERRRWPGLVPWLRQALWGGGE